MKTKFEQFLAQHRQPEPLLIGNAWNVQSARIFEKVGYQAIATSSAAVADTLGYQDGQGMPFSHYLFVIERIAHSTGLPFSVDLEAGFGESVEEVVEHLRVLKGIGVAGINIEDSVVENGQRKFLEAEPFRDKLTGICSKLRSEGIEMFINVRTDAFLLGIENPVAEAKKRIGIYQTTGVHGLFLPCITRLEDIKAVVAAASLPVNVMCMPGLPDFVELQKAGVKRISSGNFLNQAAYSRLETSLLDIRKDQHFHSLFQE